MTGAFLRIERDGQWQNLEVDELTDAELDALASSCPPEEGWRWAKFLAGWIRDRVKAEPPDPEDDGG